MHDDQDVRSVSSKPAAQQIVGRLLVGFAVCALGVLIDRHTNAAILVLSLGLTAQAGFTLHLMLYSWENPERVEASNGPRSFLPPQRSFTALLPARHEETVIHETINRVWSADYPAELLEVVVICHQSDHGTVAEAERAIAEIGSDHIRIETFTGHPINKPRGLNVGLASTRHEVVTIFDAEDDIHPDIFNVINTIMADDQIGVVQAGIQLMNFRDRWFSIHNCLEYYFWFKSRLHFHAAVGMIPLGGNTVFFRRHLLEQIGGWDESCLTEDADIGLRLSALGETIRVVYDADRVTREETPDSVASFIKQRTRWQQGFLQILGKGSWMDLPSVKQRMLAFYTLTYPILQAFLLFLWPLAVAGVLWLHPPTLIAMASFLPLYALVLQLVATLVATFAFTREYRLKLPIWMPAALIVTYIPFQLLMGVSAARAVVRMARNHGDWEKTAHAGAHRRPQPASAALGD